MKHYSIPFIAWLFFIFTSGCATTIGGKAPNFDTEKSAMLSGQKISKNLWSGQRYTLFMINGKQIEWGFFENQIDFKFPIEPGGNTLVVKSIFNAGLRDGPYIALTDLSFDATPEHSYTINGKVEDGFVFAWVEDRETKKIVSEVEKNRYIGMQPSSKFIMTYMMLFVMIPPY